MRSMKQIYKILSVGAPALLATLALSMGGCTSAFTTPESIAIHQPTIEEQNPDLYTAYLQSLKNYKKGDHTEVYGWYDNSEAVPYSRAHHLTVLPDSMDVISLMAPAMIQDWQIKEMNTVRADKGTRFIYDIDFDELKSAYKAKEEAATEEKPLDLSFQDFMLDTLQQALSLTHKYDMDGICIRYMGKSKIHMTSKELAKYNDEEALFFGILQDWTSRNTDKHIVFLGNPQNVSDKSLFDKCHRVLASAIAARNTNEFTFLLHQANRDGVPSDKLGLVVSGTYTNDPNKEKGYLANGRLAARGLAEWAPYDYNGVRVQAVGIQNISPDYYSPERVYDICRTLIENTNPSRK